MNFRAIVNNQIEKLRGNTTRSILEKYYGRFKKYAFTDRKCQLPEQFQASITRLYHTIEKGLSYEDYRAGFGRGNVESLILSMRQYALRGYDTSAFFYETALSCLYAYVEKNKAHGHRDPELEEQIRALAGRPNEVGGTVVISGPPHPENLNYEQLVTTRHSIRQFSDRPVDMDLLREAVALAQFTPSACNRQGWKTRIIADKEKMREILANQNGNRGFGQGFDKLLVITADLRAQIRDREVFEAFIDGGMYAQSVLNSLYFKGIGSVPLSAALTTEQEKVIRRIIGIDDAEIFILFIGTGVYPDETFLAARSERSIREIEVI